MRPLIDCHNHSTHSFDGHQPVETIIRNAEKIGLSVLAITDHSDLSPEVYPKEQIVTTVCGSVDEVKRWRAEHDSPVKILTGFELGEPIDYPELAEEMLALREVDMVLGSIHEGSNGRDFYYMDCKNEPVDYLMGMIHDYYDRLIRLVEWGKFDVLTHITYPLRYVMGDAGIPVDMEQFREKIDTILKGIIEKGISLEINTSGLRQKIGQTLPGKDILTRYYELGGRMITIGSDSHREEHFAYGIPDVQEMLKEIGFTELTYFEERKPKTIAL